jgi:hypothetical protein
MAVSDDATTDRADRSAAVAFPTENLPRPVVRNSENAPIAQKKYWNHDPTRSPSTSPSVLMKTPGPM